MEKLFKLLTLMKEEDNYERYLIRDNLLIKEAASYICKLMYNLFDKYDKKIVPFAVRKQIEKNYIDGLKQFNMRKILELNMQEMPKNACFILVSNMTHFIKEILSDEVIAKYVKSKEFYKGRKIKTITRFNYEYLHHSVCTKIFKGIETPKNSFWVQIDHDDMGIQEEGQRELYDFESSKSRSYIRLSIVSEKVLEYDNLIFGILSGENAPLKEFVKEAYRPYFIEYYLDIRKLCKTQKDFLSEEAFHGTWFKARFTTDKEQNSEDGISFDGVFASSASPVKYKRKKLLIDDSRVDSDEINKIDATYQLSDDYCSDDYTIEKKLKSMFSDVTFSKVRIYKVGNANCIYCHGRTTTKNGSKKKRLLYDIGFDTLESFRADLKKMPLPYEKLFRSIRNFTPTCVMLSHWDTDHYKACVYAKKDIFECSWIAPDFTDASANAKRLGVYLYRLNRITFVNRTPSREIRISLRSGRTLILYIGKKSRKISKANCEGVAVKFENKVGSNRCISCMMMGDVPYNSLPASANFTNETPYDYFVVPHHGSDLDTKAFPSTLAKKGNAVICCNNKNEKVPNRPNTTHLNELENHYNNVELTENATKYVQFNILNDDSIVTK